MDWEPIKDRLKKGFLPSPKGFDTLYWLYSLFGFVLAHATENCKRYKMGYADQLKEAGPSTIFGYIVGSIAGMIPISEDLVSMPVIINFLPFYTNYEYSECASAQIGYYVVYAGKAFGWRTTAFMMAFGFSMSPMLTTIMPLCRNPRHSLEPHMIGIISSPAQQFINWVLEGFHALPGCLRIAFEWLFRHICTVYGLSMEYQAVVYRRQGSSKKADYFNFFEDPDDAGRLPDRFLNTLSSTIAPGRKLSNVSCEIRNASLTQRGQEVKVSGSPEYKIIKVIKNSKDDAPSLTERMLPYLPETTRENLQICLDKGYVFFENGIAKLKQPEWGRDKTKDTLTEFESGTRIGYNKLMYYMDRGFIDGVIVVNARYVVPNTPIVYSQYTIPDSQGNGAPI